jgi:hypothetical protein
VIVISKAVIVFVIGRLHHFRIRQAGHRSRLMVIYRLGLGLSEAALGLDEIDEWTSRTSPSASPRCSGMLTFPVKVVAGQSEEQCL